MALDPRQMSPQDRAFLEAKAIEQSAAAQASFIGQMHAEQMHNEIVRAQVLTGKTFYSESGQAGPAPPPPNDNLQGDPNAKTVGSAEWWAAQIAARETAAAANVQSSPISPTTLGYKEYVAPPATIQQQADISERQYIESLPKPFISSTPAQQNMNLPGPMGMTVTGISKLQAAPPVTSLPGPMSMTVTSVERIGNVSNQEPLVTARIAPSSSGSLPDVIGFGLLALGAEWSKNTEEFFSNIQGRIPANQLTAIPKAGLGFVEAAPQLAAFIPLVAGSAYVFGRDVTWGTQQIVPTAENLFASTVKRGVEQPERTFGNFVGAMAAGEFVSPQINRVAANIIERNPVGIRTLEVPTKGPIYPSAEDLFYTSKLSGSPVVKGLYEDLFPRKEFVASNTYTYLGVGKTPVIGFARGAQIEPTVFAGRSGIESLLARTEIQMPTEFYQSKIVPWTSAQQEILNPFFAKTAEDSFTTAMATIKTNLERSAGSLSGKYQQYQPVGMAKQMDLSFEQNLAIQKVIEMGGPETKFYGSKSLEDVVGPEFWRDVSQSDKDIQTSMAASTQQFKELKGEVLQRSLSKTPYTITKNTLWDATLKEIGQGTKFTPIRELPETAIKAAADLNERILTLGEFGKENVFGTHPLETGTPIDVMKMRSITGGTVNVQTPESFVLTKLGRTVGRGGGVPEEFVGSVFEYDPKTQQTSVSVVGGKPISDLIDIYASTRYIAKTAYEKNLYSLGKEFEQTSNAIAARLERGVEGESTLIGDVIERDILQGVRKGPINTSQILGIDVPGYSAFKERPEVYGSAMGEVGTTDSYNVFLVNVGLRPNQYAYQYFTRISEPAKDIGYEYYPSTVTDRFERYLAKVSPISEEYPSKVIQLYKSGGREGEYPLKLVEPYKGIEDLTRYSGNVGEVYGKATGEGFGGKESPWLITREDLIIPTSSKTPELYKKKRKPKSSIIFREILPIITPIEELGGFKQGKSFFRAIGNQQIMEVTPQKRDYLHYVDVDQDVRELQQKETASRVSDMAGTKFFRTATKQEKAKTGKPIMEYTPTQQELTMAKTVGFGSGSKSKKGRKQPWF